MMNDMMIKYVFGKTEYISRTYVNLKALFNNYDYSKFLPALLAIWFTTTIALIIINYPKKNSDDKNAKLERSVLITRMMLIFIVALLLIICYYS